MILLLFFIIILINILKIEKYSILLV